MDEPDDRAAARDAVAAAVARLASADARTELRVDLTTRRGILGRGHALEPRERVWRLGAVCLDARGGLFATGQVLVVAGERHPNFRSNVALERTELQRLAGRAGIPVGETIVIDAAPLDLDAEGLAPPLRESDAGVGVAWTPGGAPIPLGAYLAERVSLLLDPPASVG